MNNLCSLLTTLLLISGCSQDQSIPEKQLPEEGSVFINGGWNLDHQSVHLQAEYLDRSKTPKVKIKIAVNKNGKCYKKVLNTTSVGELEKDQTYQFINFENLEESGSCPDDTNLTEINRDEVKQLKQVQSALFQANTGALTTNLPDDVTDEVLYIAQGTYNYYSSNSTLHFIQPIVNIRTSEISGIALPLIVLNQYEESGFFKFGNFDPNQSLKGQPRFDSVDPKLASWRAKAACFMFHFNIHYADFKKYGVSSEDFFDQIVAAYYVNDPMFFVDQYPEVQVCLK